MITIPKRFKMQNNQDGKTFLKSYSRQISISMRKTLREYKKALLLGTNYLFKKVLKIYNKMKVNLQEKDF